MTTGSSPDEDPGMIERIEAGEPPKSPEEAQARAPYEHLLERIRDLDDIAPSAGWEDRAATRWVAARRKRRLGIVVGATAAGALAAVLLLRPCSAPSVPRLEVAVVPGPGSLHRGDAAVGDLLRARARVDQPHVDLRVYLRSRLIVQCSDSAQCRREASVIELDWKLGEAGAYQIVVLSGASNIPAGDGTIDRDLLEARGAGVTIELRPLAVSP